MVGRQFPGGGDGPLQQSSNDDGVTMLRAIAGNLAKLVQAFAGLISTQGTVGVVTLAAAADTVVQNVTIRPGSLVLLMPQNDDAATLVGSAESPYVDPAAIVDGVSFTISTASGAASGTEIFGYQIINVI